MPGVPSNKSCERCKKRHLKCDEARPQCQRCVAAGVECPGYVQTRKFIDQGASVRRRYAPYQESSTASSDARNTLRSHAAKPSSPAPEQEPQAAAVEQEQVQSQPHWPEPPRNVQPQPAVRSAVPAWNGNPLTIPFPGQPPSSHSSRSVSRHGGYEEITGPGSVHQPSSAASPSQSEEREEFRDIFSELMTGTEHEMSYLVRYYSDYLASWLDISDTGNFFSAYVPVRAIDEEFSRNAIAALAAKHLAKMKGMTAANNTGMFTSPPTMETYPNASHVDWSLKAANYYYLAVSQMNTAISDYGSVSTSAVLESPIAIVNQWLSLQTSEMERAVDKTFDDATCKKAENLLATSAILTLYKILDEPGENWQSYLTGIKPAFSQILTLFNRNDGSSPSFSTGITAVFWNFARLDYLASYYNRLPTHLDPKDLAVWRAAGLSLDDQGNAAPHETMPSGHLFSREDMATNVLTRLLNKLTNFLAAAKRSQLEHWAGGPSESPTAASANPPSPSMQPTTATWLKLSFEFQSWVERIPETFRPCLRLERPKPFTPDAPPMPFPEIFYSLTACASAMQQYHFGRLALSLNRPVDEVSGPSTGFDRLQGYRELTKEVDYRCREICGVALGRPRGAARVQMITLLYAAGQCLEKPEERQIVADLLRGIEADLGWSTASQVQRLKR
ncbi:hypothetical protein BJY01DRAFT_201333 [Aspergillus pseudoustus]|uniref:Zn(2)-C6 fungal-type domain-containing protein n=1 Tax=Aspergillus pseudoustus TaxID=1810923 RepID=A0ABR4L4X9_9EURO